MDLATLLVSLLDWMYFIHTSTPANGYRETGLPGHGLVLYARVFCN
jgi:hypothetical protein